MPARNTLFTTIRTEGALLPADLLQRITEGTTLDGLTPESYHRPGEKLNEVINRSWNALQGIWASFRTAQARLPEGDSGTTLTRERWLLPLFRELDYGRLPTAPAAEIDGRSYPISHAWEQVPVHLVSYKLDLDKRTPGATGAAAASPHSLLQVFLNRSEGHLWGFVSNGYKLRLLRDNASLTRQAYVEFDLEAMLEGEVYSDFVLLWLLCHQSRLEGERPTDCWLEKWMKVAEEQGTRALDQLREGVEAAITALGLGFLEYPANHALRDKLTSGELKKEDYYRQLLRMVYRLLFLFVAEDRDLLLNPQADSVARERYILYYSTQRLRRMAENFKGTRHPDLFEGLRLVMRLLSGDAAISRSELPFSSDAHPTNTALSQPGASRKEKGLRPKEVPVGGDEVPSLRHAPQNRPLESAGNAGLGLVPLGSYLFSDGAVTDLIACQIANTHLLDALRALSLTYDHQAQVYRTVDYKNLGSDELGSIFESLLELHPQINVPARRFGLATAAGNERKTTGSYYTPESLVHALLDSALDPVIESALRGTSVSPLPTPNLPSPKGRRAGDEGQASTAEQRLLNLKVCDPACGSGHFLIAAANRLAKALAFVRTGEEEPPPAAIQEARRDVISHCIYGVDINPMAVELCKVNLWLEALEPGKPLNFLDHRIQVGNSLLGTTPRLMAEGIPDDAFNPIEGDDPKVAATLKKRNKQERKQREAEVYQRGLWDDAPAADYAHLTAAMHALDDTPDNSLDEVRRKEAQYAALADDPEYIKARLLADAWCAAFVWEKGSPLPAVPSSADGEGRGAGGEGGPGVRADVLTDLLYRRLEDNPLAENLQSVRAYIVELKERYQFFHWHVAFPDVFTVADSPLPDANAEGLGLRAEGLGMRAGWHGGFDCVLGNPPWERIKIQEKEWFAERAPEIANAPNAAARKRQIEALQQTDPAVYAAFQADLRKAEGESHFVRVSDRFPLCGRGDVNTYTIFAETTRHIINGYGRVGMIVPSGIATDDTTKFFFQDLMQTQSLACFYDFENRDAIFSGVHRSYKFALVTMTGAEVPAGVSEFIFFAHNVSDLTDPDRRFTLSARDIAALNPNTGTMATFRSVRDAEITKGIYRRVPVLLREEPLENPWGIRFATMFHMSNDSHLFHTRADLESAGFTLYGNHFVRGDERYLPLYEAKLMHQFTHRWATYDVGLGRDRVNHWTIQPDEAASDTDKLLTRDLSPDELRDPSALVMPRYWVDIKYITSQTSDNWLLAHRKTARSTDERTMIVSPLPLAAVGDKAPLLFVTEVISAILLTSALNALACDYVMRQKLGATDISQFYAKQLPVIPPHTYTQPLLDFIVPRVLELTYTAWDLQPFAQDVGYHGPPFIWDEERRFLLRCELDALYFHLYHIQRDDVDYIMETFPIVKRKDIARTAAGGEGREGEYLTKRIILEMYDQMAALPTMHVPAPKSPPRPEGEGDLGGEGYAVPDVSHWQTWLNPPPADPSVAHKE
ncbi:MAG: N-6 DNA methylase [Anaerolineae bacterium]|nr:N-6 DNA methylase [Anaerolineae bacterium]